MSTRSSDDDELKELTAEAWLYLFPLVLMQLTRAAEDDPEVNAWAHAEAFRTHDFTSVIRPNVDTRYSHPGST